MKLSEIPVPEIYKESSDFRFFMKWFENSLSRIKYDTENIIDLYDPLRCKSELLWLLADTMGFKFDDRLPVAFNRLVLLYFMSMIRYKGSKNGVMLAAEVNLAQFNINAYGEENNILYDRLEDTSIPVNAVYVTPHVEDGYIDVVYFSSEKPVDACIEYVRPLGMYCFQHAGVRVDSRTKISIDARLTNEHDTYVSVGPTHVGHYRRADYASMQKMKNQEKHEIDYSHTRNGVYYRNMKNETAPAPVNPGYRTLFSLQLCNNEHIVKAMIPSKDDPNVMVEQKEKIFGLGYGPLDVSVSVPQSPISNYYNLHYDKPTDEMYTYGKPVRDTSGKIVAYVYDTYMTEDGSTPKAPVPAVNPPMASLGDAIQIVTQDGEIKYSDVDSDGDIKLK